MPHSSPFARTMFAAVLCISLLACSEQPVEAAPVAASPKRSLLAVADKSTTRSLMAAVFGDDFRAKANDALAALPGAGIDAPSSYWVLTAVSATVLPDGVAILATNSEHAADDGSAWSSHVDGGLLSVFLLQKTESGWAPLARHVHVATLGSHGQIGTVEWVQLGAGKPALAVTGGGVWQGYSIANIAFFAPTVGDIVPLGWFRLRSDNDGACVPELEKCWNIHGSWHVEPSSGHAAFDDIVVDFSGQLSSGTRSRYQAADGPVERTTQQVASQARYAFDGKHYTQASGPNPVPGI